jgi:magnesium transporter
MGGEASSAVAALHKRFLLDHPFEASLRLEAMPVAEAAGLLAELPPLAAVRTWQALSSDAARAVLERLPRDFALRVLTDAEPAASAAALAQLEAEPREALLGALEPQVAFDLRQLLAYPAEAAGRLMDRHVSPLRGTLLVAEALDRLKASKRHGLRELFVLDEAGKLSGRVEIQDLAVAEKTQPINALARPLTAAVQELDPREEVVSLLQRHALTELPVINVEGKFVGVIRQAALVSAIEQETSVDLQTMVGASREERALSGPAFAVKKRLPWLQINLLTAFLAAAVVGLFEGTIARFTALAVLLPVVAGQSGNAGAQALAVTMRGLVLREIGVRHWPRIVWKETRVGLVNGLATAATTAVGVYVWSRSTGLVLVISSAMVIAMVIAGAAGALVPIVLRRLGQDPAQSSSIVLTTVTDVAGFFSFLGIATLLSGLLG